MVHFNSTCPLPAEAEKFGVHGTAHKPMLYVAAVCTLVTTVVSLSLCTLHLRRYRAPKEQRQILRIVFSVVVYSFVALFELVSYGAAQYIDPIGDVYEAFGLCALFLLFIQYAAPTGTFNDDTLDAVRAAEENTSQTSFDWPRISWIFVFQYPVVEILSVTIQEVTEAIGRYCINSLSPQFAHIWIQIIESVAIGACIMAILKFRGRMKNLMKVRRGLSKLICFKGIVFIRFAQSWVFSTLLEHNVIKTSASFSYNDILWGLPSVLTCAEMVLFALGFWYAFSSTEYSSNAHPRDRPLPLWKAVLHALNPWDLLVGIAKVIPFCGLMHRTGNWKIYREAVKEQGLSGTVRKGIGKYRNRNVTKPGRYQELDESMEALSKPPELHHYRAESGDSHSNSGDDNVGSLADPGVYYQPPAGSPPEDPSYLTTGAAPSGRPRSPSESSLMAETQSFTNRSRSSSAGEWNGQRYYRSLSPDPGFESVPRPGRDMT